MLLGGLAGWALARFGAFRGRALFGALAGAPLVLPEVVTGLSLLLLFVVLQGAAERWLGWRLGRGAGTILLAHATVGLAYVAVVVQSRLAGLDRGLEEAAADLGAGPFTVFRTITLPLIAPEPRRRLAAGLHPVAGRRGGGQLRLRPGRHHPADAGLLRPQGGADAGGECPGDRHPGRRRAGRSAVPG